MSEENKTLIYTELQSGIVGGYVTDYLQIKNAPNKNVNVQAVDTLEVIDDVETNTYIKYTEQTLTEEQKQQARNNISAQNLLVSGTNIKTINGTSIIGSGDIVISTSQKSVVDARLNERNITIDSMIPNTIYITSDSIIDEGVTININGFQTPTNSDIYCEYNYYFSTGNFAPTLSLPEYVMWANGSFPELQSDVAYELSITATKVGTDYIYKAILVSFKQV